MAYSIAAWQEQFNHRPKIEVFPSPLHDYVQKELQCLSEPHLSAQDHLSKPIPKLVSLFLFS